MGLLELLIYVLLLVLGAKSYQNNYMIQMKHDLTHQNHKIIVLFQLTYKKCNQLMVFISYKVTLLLSRL